MSYTEQQIQDFCKTAKHTAQYNRMPTLEVALQLIEELQVKIATTKEIIEIIMTQHWDMAACRCWICERGRLAGCAPKDKYLKRNMDRSVSPVNVEGS